MGKQLPLWSKLLFFTVIACFILSISGTIFSINYGILFCKQASDPSYIAQTMSQIANFSNTLPPGFQYEMAVSILDRHFVSIIHPSDKTEFKLALLPPIEKEFKNSKELLDNIADKGIPEIFGEMKIADTGSFPVCDQELNYVIGKTGTSEKESFPCLIGCIILKNNRKAFLIYGQTTQEKISLETAKELLSTIKNFN